MRTRFVHVADVHLGYEQYNSVDRLKDFARAYLAVVDHAISFDAHFLLLAGDLFHRATADAWMLRQATVGLERLRAAGIPVVAVEGNHDEQHSRKHLSWLEYLCDQELLTLLNVRVEPNGYKALLPWNPETRRGSYIDIAGVRIYGLKYYGAATGKILEEVRSQIEPGPEGYTVLMLHAGIVGQVPHLHGGLTPNQLAALHPPVDYLALGHVHKRLMDDNWIFNPGSTETNSMEEYTWPHGFFAVEVDTDCEPKQTVTAIDLPGVRPFRRIAVSTEGTSSLEAYIDKAERAIERTPDVPRGAVIELALGGVADFRRQDVPVQRLQSAVEARFSPLLVRVRNSLTPPGTLPITGGDRLRRADLERQQIERLIYQQGDYRDRTSAWTNLVLDVKNMATERDLAANIVDYVRVALREMNIPVAEPPPSELPMAEDEPLGGEPPCMAPLFEEW